MFGTLFNPIARQYTSPLSVAEIHQRIKESTFSHHQADQYWTRYLYIDERDRNTLRLKMETQIRGFANVQTIRLHLLIYPREQVTQIHVQHAMYFRTREKTIREMLRDLIEATPVVERV